MSEHQSTTETRVTHTPGPWRVVNNWIHVANGPACIACAAGSTRKETHPDDPTWTREVNVRPTEEIAANARLIAAAPDLLAALKTILDGFEEGIFVRDALRDADASWAVRLLPFIKALQDAQRAILRAEGQ